MRISQDELQEMEPRQLAHLIENARDAIVSNESSTESMRALADVAAEAGSRIVAIDGKRIDYNSEKPR